MNNYLATVEPQSLVSVRARLSWDTLSRFPRQCSDIVEVSSIT